jgi:serine/threonine protein kinase
VVDNNSKEIGDSHFANNENVVSEKCLHNFVLGKKIGAGTFSKVCIAKHKITKEQVAIKII